MGGVGVGLIGLGLARLPHSKGWNLAAIVGGGLLVLFATGLPQELTGRTVRAFDAHVRRAHREDDAAAASKLLFEGGECLSLLPTRTSAEIVGFGFLEAIANKLKPSPIGTYQRQHRAAIVHAVEAGVDAGATDEGALQLAQNAQSNADLLALEAKMFKMALELRPS
jgi:hypothetical protein